MFCVDFVQDFILLLTQPTQHIDVFSFSQNCYVF
jgi:hypothetical protein